MERDVFSAGCSAMSWAGEDGTHYFGRNFDFNRLDKGSGVLFLPRGTEVCTLSKEGARREVFPARCAALGMGTLSIPGTPVLYDGVNEQGLAGGQLYYREMAHYEHAARAGAVPVQAGLVLTYILSQCATVEEAAHEFLGGLTLVNEPLFGAVPPLHWFFCDRTGESIVVEPDEGGVRVHRNALGVMTNSPSYGWHCQNLLNFVQIRDLDRDGFSMDGRKMPQCFSGSGALGMPGDFTSPSRFVRLSFLREYAVRGRTEEESVTRLFRLLSSAAFPLGMVRVSDFSDVTEHDENVLPYDYTVYSSVACLETLRYYWTSYENLRVQFADLRDLAGERAIKRIEIGARADFCRRSEGLKPSDR